MPPHQMHLKLGASALPAYKQPSARIILSGSTECPLPKDAEQKPFEDLFIQTMSQGVALDDEHRPHFFLPKTYLESTGRSIFRSKIDNAHFAYGLSDIVVVKNQPGNIDDPAIQQEAKTAIQEYLDPDLFRASPTPNPDELIEIYSLLSPDARKDPLLNQCLIHADTKRVAAAKSSEFAAHNWPPDDNSRAREQRPEYIPNPGSFLVGPDTTIETILDNLKNSSNRAGFERINAIRKWGDFIKNNIRDANYEEKIVSFGSDPRVQNWYRRYSDDNVYAVISFDYAGRRCMIAESCGSGGADSVSASMLIWRSEPEDINDKEGWWRIFRRNKTEAIENNLCKTLKHFDFVEQISQRDSTDDDYIIEAEDRMFRSAFHYFETGKFLGGSKSAAAQLDRSIGPEFRRPRS